MIKQFIKEYGMVSLIVIAVLVVVWLWVSASNSEVRYETLKTETDKATKRLESERVELRSQINSLLDNNNMLVSRIDNMAVENRRLAGAVTQVREEANRRVESVPSMVLNDVVVATMESLSLGPPSIRTTADGFALFEPEASRVNLEHLILGDAAREELTLTNKRIKNFEQQMVTGREIYSNLQEVLKKRDKELDNIQIQHHAVLDLQRAKLKAVKKVARRNHIMYLAAGAVAGILVARN